MKNLTAAVNNRSPRVTGSDLLPALAVPLWQSNRLGEKGQTTSAALRPGSLIRVQNQNGARLPTLSLPRG